MISTTGKRAPFSASIRGSLRKSVFSYNLFSTLFQNRFSLCLRIVQAPWIRLKFPSPLNHQLICILRVPSPIQLHLVLSTVNIICPGIACVTNAVTTRTSRDIRFIIKCKWGGGGGGGGESRGGSWSGRNPFGWAVKMWSCQKSPAWKVGHAMLMRPNKQQCMAANEPGEMVMSMRHVMSTRVWCVHLALNIIKIYELESTLVFSLSCCGWQFVLWPSRGEFLLLKSAMEIFDQLRYFKFALRDISL